jgi:hypothetical protein
VRTDNALSCAERCKEVLDHFPLAKGLVLAEPPPRLQGLLKRLEVAFRGTSQYSTAVQSVHHYGSGEVRGKFQWPGGAGVVRTGVERMERRDTVCERERADYFPLMKAFTGCVTAASLGPSQPPPDCFSHPRFQQDNIIHSLTVCAVIIFDSYAGQYVCVGSWGGSRCGSS